MTSPEQPPLRHGSGQVLIFVSCVLAVVAAAALVLGTEDVRLLRVGILAALWAALCGTVAAVTLRRAAGPDRVEELRKAYHLELEREIAARREHELTVERELREQAERREREDLVALRGELTTLRETLRTLLGGDLLVERVALRAESTRLRPLPDRSWTGADPDTSQRRPEPIEVPARPAAESAPRVDSHLPPSPPEQAGLDIFARTAAELAGPSSFAERTWRPAVSSSSSWEPAVSPPPPPTPPSPPPSPPSPPSPPPSPPPSSPPSWKPAVSSASSWESAVPSYAETESRRGTGHRRAEPQLPDPDASATSGSVPRQVVGGGKHSRPRTGNTVPALNVAGSHAGTAGTQRPVDDLLAAHGEPAAPRHRRRRTD